MKKFFIPVIFLVLLSLIVACQASFLPTEGAETSLPPTPTAQHHYLQLLHLLQRIHWKVMGQRNFRMK